MTNEELLKKANSFMLFNANEYLKKLTGEDTFASEIITIEKASSFPEKWAIRRSGGCWSKTENAFCYERNPSSRDEEFFKEFRFSSLEDALIIGEKIASAYERAYINWYDFVYVKKNDNPYVARFVQDEMKKSFSTEV